MRNLAGATLDNLRGAVLDGCDVSDVSLSGVDCSEATLGSCNLTGARLRGAIGLSGLRFAGAHDFPAVRVDALRPGNVVVLAGALRVVRVRADYSPRHIGSYSKVHFEEGQLWDVVSNTTTVPCCQR